MIKVDCAMCVCVAHTLVLADINIDLIHTEALALGFRYLANAKNRQKLP